MFGRNEKINRGGVKVDLILCDPPYGTTDCEWDTIIDMNILIPLCFDILKHNGRMVIFGNSPFYDSFLYKSCIKIHKNNIDKSKYFNYSGEMIWKKSSLSNPLGINKQLARYHEKIMILNKHDSFNRARYNLKFTYNPYTKIKNENQISKEKMIEQANHLKQTNKHLNVKNWEIDSHNNNRAKDYDYTQYCNYPKSVYECKHDRYNIHPTQKPVKLLEHLIKLFSNENETILDFTMGVGSTGVAAKKCNRGFIGIELDKEYFKIAQQRIENEERFVIENNLKKDDNENQLNLFQIIDEISN